jgi:hypothetical protein
LTVKVVEPMKVRGVLGSMGNSSTVLVVVRTGPSVGAGMRSSHRGNRRDLRLRGDGAGDPRCR